LMDLLTQLNAELLFKLVIFETARSGANHAVLEVWRRDCGEHRPSHPGCRECKIDPGAYRVTSAAGRYRRDPRHHLASADRPPTRGRGGGGERRPPLRGNRRIDLPRGW